MQQQQQHRAKPVDANDGQRPDGHEHRAGLDKGAHRTQERRKHPAVEDEVGVGVWNAEQGHHDVGDGEVDEIEVQLGWDVVVLDQHHDGHQVEGERGDRHDRVEGGEYHLVRPITQRLQQREIVRVNLEVSDRVVARFVEIVKHLDCIHFDDDTVGHTPGVDRFHGPQRINTLGKFKRLITSQSRLAQEIFFAPINKKIN